MLGTQFDILLMKGHMASFSRILIGSLGPIHVTQPAERAMRLSLDELISKMLLSYMSTKVGSLNAHGLLNQ